MSVIPPLHRPLQQFFRSGPLPCPYLPGRVERKLFTRLVGGHATEVNAELSRAGFRRSHDIVYRPVCTGCNACVPVRIPTDRFQPNRSMRRIERANTDLTFALAPPVATMEQFQLFAAYQDSRHNDSDMNRMTPGDFAAMVEEGQAGTLVLEARDSHGRLCGAMLVDRLDDGYSAVYSFYDTVEPRRSLGTQLILALISLCQQQGLPYLYLGYWIEGSRKMEYKARFQPLEALGSDGWMPLILSEEMMRKAGD
ncbi:arginyltransferase [Niveispirillum irakense]|uniref:arginyltransferase n=1 Tax=Niveispirillum irakense TaxID=34011 RepID=UPI000410E115|nr:arginyltransferase [Niveispirillum irakense]